MTERRQRFTRLVTYTMGGLVAFTLLGLACFAWRHHSMQAELAATPPAPPIAVAAPVRASAPPAPVANADAPAPVAAPAKPKAAPFKRAVKPTARPLATKTSKVGVSASSKLSATRR